MLSENVLFIVMRHALHTPLITSRLSGSETKETQREEGH